MDPHRKERWAASLQLAQDAGVPDLFQLRDVVVERAEGDAEDLGEGGDTVGRGGQHVAGRADEVSLTTVGRVYLGEGRGAVRGRRRVRCGAVRSPRFRGINAAVRYQATALIAVLNE
ncbi:hypothetical protein GCM10010121_046450 [Streptomyces brasiliensis]|uniref:Uncharacterized protein n=1 Tax=Streptomyces brasiliensis TaxID=1954 RepID=A0A917NU08_9ACTN|nr:hypothetical protein GCM10010121_046450 [Streptomyces brasiliensis]